MRRAASQPIDRAVLERSTRVLVARAAFRWSDVGTWTAVAALLREGTMSRSRAGRVLALEAPNCIGINESGLCVFVGVKDLIAVRAGEVVLVCRRQAAQRVRHVAGGLLKGPLRRYA